MGTGTVGATLEAPLVSCSARRMSRTRPNVLITGTPGCGKTTTSQLIASMLDGQMKHIEVSKLVAEKGLHEGRDEEHDCWIIDDDAVVDELEDSMTAGGVIIDTHSLIDYFPERWFDCVVVLRADNTVLYDRLGERGYSEDKVQENVQCEIMEVVLEEARSSYKPDIIVELVSDNADQLDANAEQVAQWIKEWQPTNSHVK